MGLQRLLVDIAKTYDASAGTKRDVDGQRILRGVRNRADLELPEPLYARGYGGQSTAAATPWIGVYDPQINEAAVEGLYLAYIFSTDLRTVWLTLQQGITSLESKVGKGLAREQHLRRSAARLRRLSAIQRRQGWVDEPELKPTATRPKAYEAASVIARCYRTSKIPGDRELAEDLVYASGVLREVHRANELWLFGDSDENLTVTYANMGHSHQRGAERDEDPLAGFEPKSSSDYVAQIAAKQQVKRRSHEALIRDFGMYAATRGFVPITRMQHPRDLVLRPATPAIERSADEWLVEAKVIRRQNPTEAVRQAVGQLMEYRAFLYQGLKSPHLLGLFSGDIGVYESYLEGLGIGSVWRSAGGWSGSASAVRCGIVG
ncbi:MrcB family domain-containing protein [Streptomyces sp. DW26H14]|uniref:MrcB family domain-containing protein n=1 Tax=Streptomyces sp. DW26H14 TaxID=3435395 RepID=UPI00403D89B8